MSVFDFESDYVLKKNSSVPLDSLFADHFPLNDPALRKAVHTSIPIPGSKREGFSEVYRNGAFPKRVKKALTPELATYGDFFKRSVIRKPNGYCLGYREYDYIQKKSAPEFTYITYSEVNQRKQNFGSGLLYLLQNSTFKDSSKYESHKLIDKHVSSYGSYDKDNLSFILTVFAPNRYEWILTDLMCNDFSITNSSLYDTLGPDVSKYILNLTQSPVIVLDRHNIQTILNLKKQFPKDLENLFLMVSMDPLDLEGTSESKSFEDVSYVQAAQELGITLIDLDRVEKIGEIFPHKELPSTLESTYTISFTSGTTGARPKGVVLLHQAAGAGISWLHPIIDVPENNRAFAFLPLAHIFERQNTAFVISKGGCVGFPQLGGSPLTLLEDLKIYKPDDMANVPRVFTKFEAAIKAATIEHPTSNFTRSLFNKVISKKTELQSQEDGDPGHHFIYDKLFLSKIREKFGYDKMLYNVSGSAPISPQTVRFLKAALNIGFAQGYGLTESFAGMSISNVFDADVGSCGACGITSEMKLKELPQMGYGANDEGGPRGELLLRGYQMFSHYYKNEEETAKAVDLEGWFHTGDVAKFDSKGRVYIIDRVKNFFKLAQGEYVTPEKIENAYLSSNPILTQLFCHGDSLKHFLIGIAGIDPAMAKTFLVETCKVDVSSLEHEKDVVEKINEKQNKQILLDYLTQQTGKEFKLQGFEKLHNIYFEIEPLRLDRNVVTPTLKLKRPVASKFFAEPINNLYAEGSLVLSNKL